MPTFLQTIQPTPFGFFDSDSAFQVEADSMVKFVKRKLGDDVLSVELTSKEIWACFEEACCEYSRHVHELKIKSELVNALGMPTGSSLTNVYPRYTLEYLMRLSEPYGAEAGVGGSYNMPLAYIDLVPGKQDYNLYTDIKDAVSGTIVYDDMTVKGKIKVMEVFHFEPLAAQHFLLNASNITNFLATQFNYESYVNSTVFYVLPIFEDVLRRGMLEAAFKVRRSHYSYEIKGPNLRIYPIPSMQMTQGLWRLYLRIQAGQNDPTNPTAFPSDGSQSGVSGPQNFPVGNIPYTSITQPGRQWIRQYTLALCTELLGLIRTKFKSIPIPNADLTLNGDDLLQKGRDDKEKLTTQLKEFLDNLTNEKLMEQQANMAENIQKQLRYVPMPKAIIIG